MKSDGNKERLKLTTYTILSLKLNNQLYLRVPELIDTIFFFTLFSIFTYLTNILDIIMLCT